MAQTYTRQSTFADGDTITAALFNDEYNQLVNAFTYSSTSASSTGHRHDGTAGQGGNIPKIGDLDFLNKIEVDSTNNRFGFYVEVSSAAVEQVRIQDGAIVPVTDNDIDLGTSSLEFKDLFLDGTATIDTLTVNEAATVGTTLGVTGATTLSSTLGVSGATTLSSTLAVTGTSTLTGNVTTTNDLSVGGNLTVTGTSTFNGGTITMGDAASDNVVFGADVNSNIIPNTDNTYDLGSSSQEWKDIYIDGTAYLDAINFNGTAITATAAELNIMDGVTATATEINLLDGVTSTTAELNILDGVTSTAAELNILDGVTSTAAELNILDGVTASTAELNLLDGVTSTTAELNILDGVTATATELNILDGVTSTTAELNVLDGITAVVGELNALDLGSTAIGTAVASKAVVLDANKDYTGIRNLTIAGDLTISGDDLFMATNTAGHLLIADGTNFNPTAVGDLSEISTVANDDVLLAVDTSGGGLKKISRSTLVAGLATSGALSNVVEDTTPQLGGDLDVNSNALVSTSNGNIALTPNGTGVVRIDGNVDIQTGEIVLKNGGSVSNIKLYCEASNAHYTQLQSAAHSAYSGNVTVTLPAATDTLVGKATTDTLTNKTLTSPKINEDVAVTATATELNILDGVTSTTAELNILDGVTSTTAELNILDGVTSTASELNILDGVTATTTELNYVDGVTSAIQTQLDAKAPVASPTFTGTITIPTADVNGGNIDGTTIGGSTAAAGTFTTFTSNGIDDNADALAMTISSSEDISIGSSSNHAGARVVINDTPPTAFGSPMFQIGQETFTSSGYYSIGLGFTNSTYTEPPAEIAAVSTSSSGGTTADIVFGTRSVTTNTAVTERMRIDSSGNVGIGGSPSGILHLKSDDNGMIFQSSSSSNSRAQIFFQNTGGTTTGKISVDPDGGNANVMAFSTGSSERMRIDSSGRVLIGTTTEGQGSADDLTIATTGNTGITIRTGTSNEGAIYFSDGTSGAAEYEGMLAYDHTSNFLRIITNHAEAMRIASDGDVGIGTSSPAQKLDVSGAAVIGSGTTRLTTYSDSTYSGFFNGSSLTSDESIYMGAGNIYFYSNGAEDMRLQSSGNLHVDGNVVAYSTTISDERLKDDVQNITNALDTVDALRGVTYTWKEGTRQGQRDYGVIAQEVEEVLPEIVYESTMPLMTGNDETLYKTVDYEKLCAVLITAVSELRAEVEALKNGASV